MVVLIVILTIVVFIVVDVFSRLALKKLETTKMRKEREKALDIGLRLDFTDEAKSLKRVEVENPKARILAVDDESIILDSFRKILVIAGYSIDTVEVGQEAIGLIQKRNYDFVFTDLKMPDMDGLEVTKAVKHFRPDVDVIMITGYATIESAVESMKYGALDYVQKPFTEDELVEFVNKSLIRRQARIEKQITPTVHLITPSVGATASKHAFNVPSGLFVSSSHTWVSIYSNGMLRIGLDDFMQKIVDQIDRIGLPDAGLKVQKGDPLFYLRHGTQEIAMPAPVSGIVTSVNTELRTRPELLQLKPYDLGWVCNVEPTDLKEDIQSLKIGADAVSWYHEEIDRYVELLKSDMEKKGEEKDKVHAEGGQTDETTWGTLSRAFLRV